MPKTILMFDTDEEREAISDAQNGWRYRMALEDVWTDCFRPLFKHGYSCQKLARLCKKKDVRSAIEMLAKIYQEKLPSVE